MHFHGGVVAILSIQLIIFAGVIDHAEGRKGFNGSEQEWGFVTVRPKAQMFWWLYYTTSDEVTDVHDKPLLIWLQGGPGASSTGYGNFEEFGPLDLQLNPRNHTWVKDYNVLFIDNPVGSGFSYAETPTAFAKTNAQIASDLVECIRGFYNELPKWLPVPVYITAESYGGKMTVEFALEWDKAQKAGTIKSNLQGVLLIDSWISPIDSVLSWGTFLLNTGMVDAQGYEKIEASAQLTKEAVENEQWTAATRLWSGTEGVIMRVTGNIDFYNILYKMSWSTFKSSSQPFKPILPSGASREVDTDALLDALMNNEVKSALGIAKDVVWGSQSNSVFSYLGADFMKPATDKVEQLLNETDIHVFVITGQMDLIVATPGTIAWVERLKWKNSTEWHKAPRNPFAVDGIIEGYLKEYGNLKMYWVNRSGHMVPKDNPAATAAMLKHLTANGKRIE
ncbi:retinoid-inducible serine carboxypeptidase-like [Venturia canescens]|uniref:retinoid-inducible serine carboxypeptidase-like n=1 Tax=Venturia canescens TaxID=32260 RepID=UPI001C9D6277|nr:retinoid-inducible serine carboxypeptidase-like [Venturia canescens]